jgi:HSP20 family protein
MRNDDMQTNSPNGGKQAERARVTAMPEGANKDALRETQAAQREQHQATRDAEHPRSSSDYSPAPWGSNPLGSFHQLTREMDEWMNSFFGGRFGFPSSFGARGRGANNISQLWQPRIDMKQKGGLLQISVDLPGVPRESVSIECTAEGIAISGERQETREETDEKGGYHFAERSHGSFYRNIPLPEGADGEQARASMKDGVLEITVPVRQLQQRRKIPIA